MSDSRRSEYSRSSSPDNKYRSSRSVSRSRSRSISRNPVSGEVENPGNNLYVTGLSSRVTKRELEDHFSSEGKVVDVHLVMDPWTRESRGFGFVTMSTIEEARSCLKHLDRSVLGGRVITVEKAKRKRGRTPTPGRYLGLKNVDVRGRSPSYSSYRRRCSRSYSSERDKSRSPSPYYSRHKSYHSRRSRSPSYERSYSPYDRSYSPYDHYYRRRDRSYSPYDHRFSRRDRSYSPYDRQYRCGRSYSPYERCYSRRDSSYSRYDRHDTHDKSYSPDKHRYSRRDRSYSPPEDRYYTRRDRSCGFSPGSRRSYSPVVSSRSSRSMLGSITPRSTPST